MTHGEDQASLLCELTAAELQEVSGGKPWAIFRSSTYSGTLDDLSTPEGYRAWSWEQYYRLYVQQREAGAVLAPGLADIAMKYGFAEMLASR